MELFTNADNASHNAQYKLVCSHSPCAIETTLTFFGMMSSVALSLKEFSQEPVPYSWRLSVGLIFSYMNSLTNHPDKSSAHNNA